MSDYVPRPIDVSDVQLSPRLLALTELLAEQVHEQWAFSRAAQGWTYGTERNDTLKTTPCMLPYRDLPNSEQEIDRQSALTALRLILKLGGKIEF